MTRVDDYMQKVKGKTQVFKGKINTQRGQGVKGGMQQIKGKVNEKMADMKLKSKNSNLT